MAPGSSTKQRDYDYLFKLVLIGDSGVGKSCLLLRFAVRLSCRCGPRPTFLKLAVGSLYSYLLAFFLRDATGRCLYGVLH